MKPATNTIHELRVAAGFVSQKALLTAIGISPKNASFGVALDKGRLPSNHPLIPKIAKILKQPEDKVKALCTGEPMDDKSIKMVATNLQKSMMERGNHGQKHALVPIRKPKNAVVVRDRRNALKRIDHRTRQAARSMTDTLNANIIKGKTYLEVVPVDDLSLILNDYFERCGIKVPLVLPPTYAESFG